MREVKWDEAIKRKYPEPVVLVVSCDLNGKPNVMPAGWSMVTSSRPPMLAVSIGHSRYTHELIKKTNEFVIVFPSEEMKNLIDPLGSCSGRNVDKFAKYSIETIKSKYVKPPLIKDSVACFECKVAGELITGDHTIFAGEVLASYVSDKCKYRLYNFSGKYEIIPW
jgi:flavin reductase (DIM6/NTAB) family NADH-FMN oxidoreductase RutF